MSATTVLDTMIPVKQHGFIVKDGSSTATATSTVSSSFATTSTPTITETTTTSSGLTPASLNRIPTPTKSAPPTTSSTAATAASTSTLYAISPGLPRVGDMRLAEYTHLTPGVKRIMRSVVRGLKAHQDPEAATEGLGGTYFFRNEAGTKIAIMKPCDEEPLAPNNPKGFVGRNLGEPGLKPTVRVGEAASREVAAYLLDHDHFARVPHTVMVRMSHPVFHNSNNTSDGNSNNAMSSSSSRDTSTIVEEDDNNNTMDNDDGNDEVPLPLKLGSLQEFVPHECDTSELGSSRFSVQDVHRIGILDIRLFNTDRHAGNILVRKPLPQSSSSSSNTTNTTAIDGVSSTLADLCLKSDKQYELVPIDHGFALPEALEPPYFEWQHWPQAMMPFSQEELEYIAKLDPVADVELLRRELPGLREESLRLLEVSTTLLKRCAAAGLSLSEIAHVVTRPLIGLDDEPSELEKICVTAREDADDDEYGDDDDDDDDESGSDNSSECDSDECSDGGEYLSGVDEEDEDEMIADAYAAALTPSYTNTTTNATTAIVHDDMRSAFQQQHHHGNGEDVDVATTIVTPMIAKNNSATTAMTSSDASRQTASMDDALFSMDEDNTHHHQHGSNSAVMTPEPRSPTYNTTTTTNNNTSSTTTTNANATNNTNTNATTTINNSTMPAMDSLHRRFLVKAPSLIVKRSGEIATPGGVVGASFGSALASSDSLPASYDSEDSPTTMTTTTTTRSTTTTTSSTSTTMTTTNAMNSNSVSSSMMSESAMLMSSTIASPSSIDDDKNTLFHGVPSTYVPGGFMMGNTSAATAIVGSRHFSSSVVSSKQKQRRRAPNTVTRSSSHRSSKHHQNNYTSTTTTNTTTTTRRRGAHRGGLRSRGHAYPPLVAPRCTPSSTSNVFSDLTEHGWRRFMKSFIEQVDDALRRDAWRQSKGNNGPAPLMSCPKF